MPNPSEDFGEKLDFEPDTDGVPDEITQFAGLTLGDDYDEQMAELLNFLNDFFQHRMVTDGNGYPAAVIPKYTSDDLDDVDTETWVNRTADDRDPAIIRDGELVRVR